MMVPMCDDELYQHLGVFGHAVGPDGKPMHRISDGSGLNNLPGVFGSGGLTPDGLTGAHIACCMPSQM